ncbi:MAG: PTS sugar transporter subunit IIA [Spirochaetaceae bacterium]|jgi:mannitol/fructose-specific phosphotransferase system IIA component (Ntr-type)|nr:PTS sugar transporter subunit IIA [Spirochaetaceae bacterium]
MADFKEIFSEVTAAVQVEVKDKAAALAAAVDILGRGGKVLDAEKLREAITRREALASTGIGHGAAVPQVLCDAVSSLMFAALTLKQGIDFGAEDGQKVDLIFLIAGPKGETAAHLKLLSKLARLLHDEDFRDGLRAASDAGALTALIYERE